MTHRTIRAIALFIGFALTAGLAVAGGARQSLPGLLLETDWIEQHIGDRIVLLDTGRSAEEYSAGHIPGAVHFPVDRYYTEVDGVPGMFAGESAVETALKAAGVSNSVPVVIYDPGHGLWATRLFWSLELLGHEKVAIINGGYNKWTAEGRPVSTESVAVTPGDFQAHYNSNVIVSTVDLLENLDNTIVIDTRSPDEYDGSDLRAQRGGHIPGAININWIYNNSGGQTTTFLPVDELKEFYQAQLSGQEGNIVTHCQTGVRGAHTYFVLRLLGYDGIAVYDGSWAEWGNDPSLPIATE